MSLFGTPAMAAAQGHARQAPLAERMRPRTLEEYVGQDHLLGPGKPLRLAIEGDDATSMIFWGPPGTGKTTLAKIIARLTAASFIEFSAVLSGIKEIKNVMVEAEKAAEFGSRTILFVDEIHRFNKAQQDAFLPYVERGTIRLIGATTENPSFEINAALLSRCRVYTLQGLTEEQIIGLLERAPTQALSVLVVDDDPNAVELIAVRLEGVATRVTRAFGGRDAIAAVQAERPDLIVLDLMMPEVNGFEVIDALNADPALAGIPVIVVTAKRITVMDRERLRRSVTAIMEKGQFNREHLTREVRRAMSGRHGAA